MPGKYPVEAKSNMAASQKLANFVHLFYERVPVQHVQQICMRGVYSPTYSWQMGSPEIFAGCELTDILGPCAHRKVNFVYFVGNKELINILQKPFDNVQINDI